MTYEEINIMKRITAVVLFSIATFIRVGSASAQAQTVEAKIPFAFIVHSRVLPAGTYRIHSVGENLVEVRANDNSVVETSTTRADNNGSGTDNRLVFNKYGNQYFLREILCDSAIIRSALPASKLEKLVQIHEARLRGTEQTVASLR
jgi:hypothetical protein